MTFDGPHGYISPLWYEQPERSVPTWNYASVLIQGRVELISSKEWLLNSVLELTKNYEPNSDWENRVSQSYLNQMIGGIIGIKILVKNIESKFKLSQNKSENTRNRIISKLKQKKLKLANEMRVL